MKGWSGCAQARLAADAPAAPAVARAVARRYGDGSPAHVARAHGRNHGSEMTEDR